MPHSSIRSLLVDLFEVAVAAASAGPLTSTAMRELAVRPGQLVRVIAFGKAASAMAESAVDGIVAAGGTVAGGVIVAPAPEPSPHPRILSFAGSHPLPGPASSAAADRIGTVVRDVGAEDAVVVLVSGGATSLIAAPLPGISDADLLRLFELLLGSGLDVRQMNAIRKRFTRWGAGRLALALAPAQTHVLVMSDVPGDDPADVGSGPCAPDPCSALEVSELLGRSGVRERVPAAFFRHLSAVLHGETPETPDHLHPAFAHVSTRVIGTNRLAVDAVVVRAEALGMRASRATEPLAGAAADAGRMIASTMHDRARRRMPGVIVWGGETTVRLPAGAPAPLGGRCQELVLAAGEALDRAGDSARGITVLAAGTDGRDGPTDAAGAFADGGTWAAIRAAGVDPVLALARHESYRALDAAHALIRRGLTGTNVMDVVIGVVE